jgi:predicted peroxiredoxin
MAGDDRTYGFLITALASSPKDPGQVLRSAIKKREEGAKVEIFLMGDGVYLIKKGSSTQASEALEKAMEIGCAIMLSNDHLMAAGISQDELPEAAEVVKNPCRAIAWKSMEEWDRIIVC